MWNKIQKWWIERQFNPITKFSSIDDLVELSFSNDWIFRYKRYAYDFANPDKINGVLKILAMFNPDPNYQGYDNSKSLEEVRQLKDENAKIVELGKYPAIYHKQTIRRGRVYEHTWYTGWKNTRVFVIFNQSAEQSKQEIDKEFLSIKSILSEMKIMEKFN